MTMRQILKRVIPSRVGPAVRVFLRGDSGITDSWFQRAGCQIEARGLFVGCPLRVFEVTSKDLFCLALEEGMGPESSVLEVGCGCLRTGYQFVRYLHPGGYCGIEPHVAMLNAGRELLLGPLEDEKMPQFNHAANFDFGAFGRSFDFVVAFSIWSHASKGQIGTMLDQFKRTSAAGGKFITSWIPPRQNLPNFGGDRWVGRSHESNTPGLVAHSREWLTEAVGTRGLAVRFFEGFTTLDQHWLVITRA